MIRRTLMQRNRELADFEVDPLTGEARIIDASEAGEHLLDSERLTELVKSRAISYRRADRQDVLASFGALSAIHLALMGNGLSLSDQYWYRAPGGTERWEDINFFENEWDPGFGAAVFKRDYAGLASCSPDVPDVTTPGQIIKTWERGGGIFLIKESMYPDGADLRGVELAADLCALLFDESCYVPVDIVERYGKPCSASPLMLAPDEELADGKRLYAMAGMQEESNMGTGSATMRAMLQAHIRSYSAVGIPNASAHVARMACLSCLALLQNFHTGNIGVIRRIGSETWRAAPLFDYDGSFGFRDDEHAVVSACAHPFVAAVMCANRFSFLDPSWDWTWYDPRVLDGFENHIVKALAPYKSMPSNFAELNANMFAMQRAYVNRVVSGGHDA